jgi:hypothetical protein
MTVNKSLFAQVQITKATLFQQKFIRLFKILSQQYSAMHNILCKRRLSKPTFADVSNYASPQQDNYF